MTKTKLGYEMLRTRLHEVTEGFGRPVQDPAQPFHAPEEVEPSAEEIDADLASLGFDSGHIEQLGAQFLAEAARRFGDAGLPVAKVTESKLEAVIAPALASATAFGRGLSVFRNGAALVSRASREVLRLFEAEVLLAPRLSRGPTSLPSDQDQDWDQLDQFFVGEKAVVWPRSFEEDESPEGSIKVGVIFRNEAWKTVPPKVLVLFDDESLPEDRIRRRMSPSTVSISVRKVAGSAVRDIEFVEVSSDESQLVVRLLPQKA